MRESQDDPRTAGVTPAFWDTLPQGCWGVKESQDTPGTAGVTPAFWDTLPQECWGVKESQDTPGTASVTWDSALEVGTEHGTTGHPSQIVGRTIRYQVHA